MSHRRDDDPSGVAYGHSRKEDHGWRFAFRENWYRDLWLLIITTVVVLAALAIHSTAVKTTRTARQVTLGRRFAVSATCAVESAVARAGRDVILQSVWRRKPRATFRATGLADRYVASIANGVVQQVGVQGRGLVRSDGTLNCRRFEELAKIKSSRP